MAVTKQTYSLSPTWTAAQHADLIRQVFIDAGLMTEWYDSFLSGSMENRILEVQYDPTKTYGRTYYWFIFTGGQMYLALATGWNSVTHVPTGTQYLDFYTTTTNAITNHRLIYSWSTTTTLSMFRYQSNINPSFSWFLIRNGSSSSNFHIPHSSVGQKIVTWIDLDKVFFHHFLICITRISNNYSSIEYRQHLMLRRSYHTGAAVLRGTTYNGYFNVGTDTTNYGLYPVKKYLGVGNVNQAATGNAPQAGNYDDTRYSTPIYLPVGFNSLNPAFTTNSNPVFTGAQYSDYLFDSLPDDFGISLHYANNNMALQDTLVVSSGVEEWELVWFSNNPNGGTEGCSPLFLARIV
jgi:hypothetical protein